MYKPEQVKANTTLPSDSKAPLTYMDISPSHQITTLHPLYCVFSLILVLQVAHILCRIRCGHPASHLYLLQYTVNQRSSRQAQMKHRAHGQCVQAPTYNSLSMGRLSPALWSHIWLVHTCIVSINSSCTSIDTNHTSSLHTYQ